MRVRGIATVLTLIGVVLLVPLLSEAQQSQVPADSVQISGSQSMVWGDQKENTVEVKGPVTITLDQTKLSADNAVIWVKPATGGLAGAPNNARAICSTSSTMGVSSFCLGFRSKDSPPRSWHARLDSFPKIGSSTMDMHRYSWKHWSMRNDFQEPATALPTGSI